MKPEAESKQPVAKPRRVLEDMMSPEDAQKVRDYRKGLAESLVNNLNRNVLRKHPDKDQT